MGTSVRQNWPTIPSDETAASQSHGNKVGHFGECLAVSIVVCQSTRSSEETLRSNVGLACTMTSTSTPSELCLLARQAEMVGQQNHQGREAEDAAR